MNCNDCQNLILENFGSSELQFDCLEHLQSCSSCRQFHLELAPLRRRLGDDTLFHLTQSESSSFLETLSQRLDRPHVIDIRPRFALRRLAIAAALLLLAGAGAFRLWYATDSGSADSVAVVESGPVADSLLAIAVDLPADSLDLNDHDVQILLHDFSQNRGFEATESLLNDLTDDEIKYLQKNLNKGDIL